MLLGHRHRSRRLVGRQNTASGWALGRGRPTAAAAAAATGKSGPHDFPGQIRPVICSVCGRAAAQRHRREMELSIRPLDPPSGDRRPRRLHQLIRRIEMRRTPRYNIVTEYRSRCAIIRQVASDSPHHCRASIVSSYLPGGTYMYPRSYALFPASMCVCSQRENDISIGY